MAVCCSDRLSRSPGEMSQTPSLLPCSQASSQTGALALSGSCAIVIVLALRLSLYQLQLYRSRRSLPRRVNTILPWANLLLGLALFIAMAMSSHAAAVA